MYSVHPNPTSGNAVFIAETVNIKELEIITDLNGKVMKIINVNGHEVNDNLGVISVSGLESGIYVVYLDDDGKPLEVRGLWLKNKIVSSDPS